MASAIYFITGTTGFLGGEFLRTLLAQDPKAQCYCLIRDQNLQTAAQRFAQLKLGANVDRVFSVNGDITLPQLGLDTDEYQALAKKVTHIVHSAAMVKFEKPKEVLDKINVQGTENMLAFAQTCQKLNPEFKVFGYVGTAYVAGKRKGVVTENDFSDAYGFKNNYESSKFAAEAVVRAARTTLPIIIFRPSIIISGSDGQVSRSNVIFPLAQVAKKYTLGLVPFNKNCLLDLVPVDYVAKGIYFLLQEQSAIGQVFHLTSGSGKEMSVQQMLNIFNQVYQMNLKVVPTWTWPIGKRLFSLTRQGRYFITGVEPYRAYTLDNPQFSQQQTQSVLNKYHLSCDNIPDTLKKTLIFMEKKYFS